MEYITTGVEILVGAMGLKLVLYGVTSLGNIIKGETDDAENDY